VSSPVASIRTRLVVTAALVVTSAFLIAGVLIFWLTRATLNSQLDDGLRARAQALAALVEQDAEGIESEISAGTAGGAALEWFTLWDDRGGVLARSPQLGDHALTPAAAPRAEQLSTIELQGRRGRQLTLRFVPRYDANDRPEVPQRAVLVVVHRTNEVDVAVSKVARSVAIVGGAATLFTLVLLALGIRQALLPVRVLAAALAKLRAHDMAARLDRTLVPSELTPVVDRLNDLLVRLGAALTRERELTAELAHELRTPLAGLRATIEVAISRDREAPKYRKALADCLSICSQAEKVVNAMLALARLDADTASTTLVPVSVSEVVRDVLRPLAARIEQRKQTLVLELPDVTWMGDRDKLRVVLQNLADNAVSYCNPAGTIWITASAHQLSVSNSGCELTAEQATHVFERFWRHDASRTGRGHAGIGLALCKRLMEVMQGSIAAEVCDDRFVVTVAAPVAKA
jgi:two-component system, OmpR family, heavy metal sensor histidine kinase CusS